MMSFYEKISEFLPVLKNLLALIETNGNKVPETIQRYYIKESFKLKSLVSIAYKEFIVANPEELPLYKLSLENLPDDLIRKEFTDQFEELNHWVGLIENLTQYIYYLDFKPNLDEYQETKKKKYLNKLKAILLRTYKVINYELVPDS